MLSRYSIPRSHEKSENALEFLLLNRNRKSWIEKRQELSYTRLIQELSAEPID